MHHRGEHVTSVLQVRRHDNKKASSSVIEKFYSSSLNSRWALKLVDAWTFLGQFEDGIIAAFRD
jgi:hypothetical protein